MNIKTFLKNITSSLIIFILIFSPIAGFAEEVNVSNAPKAIVVTEGAPKATPTGGTNNSAVGASAGLASCLGSQMISKAISSAVSNAIGQGVGKVTDVLTNIPVAESGNVGANITTETSARVGTVVSAFGIGGLALPSWDSMGYCIANSMIIYVANSTLQWISTGFEGNPAFLTNPDQFFEDLVNQEKNAFINNLAYGVNSGVCGAFKDTILSSVLSRYGRNQQYNQSMYGYENGGYNQGMYGQNSSACPFDTNPNQLNQFLSGNFSQGGGWNSWYNLTQNSNNNPYDTYFRTNERLDSQVAAVQLSKTRELNWNNGYLSFRKCDNEKQDKKTCPITTPGTVIQSKLESTLNLGTNRLVLAEKFDQVVTAIVDQLITTAIDKTFEAVNGN